MKTEAESKAGPSLTTRARSLAPLDFEAGGDAGGPEAGGGGDAHLGALSWGRDGDGGGDGRARVVATPRPPGRPSPPGTRIQSVSKVESVKTLIPASASGASSALSTPVRAKSSGPGDLRTR